MTCPGRWGRGSEVLREVSWVIFDEIHYMQARLCPLQALFIHKGQARPVHH